MMRRTASHRRLRSATVNTGFETMVPAGFGSKLWVEAGMKVLANIEEMGFPVQGSALVTTDRFIKKITTWCGAR